jgi:hypothetical protein
MAELAGSVAGLLTLAGLAGQGLQAILFLKDFLRDMKGAHHDLENVSQEICSLEDLLQYIENLKADPPTRELSVQTGFRDSLADQLKKCIGDLEIFKSRIYLLNPTGQSSMKVWKQSFRKEAQRNQFLSIREQISSHRGKLMMLVLRFVGQVN